MLDTDSELVELAKDHNIDNAADSVYSVIGIVNKIQKIADRTVILGEMRSDLLSVTDAAPLDLRHVADFTACGSSAVEDTTYNRPEDYYAVINNCNFFLAHVDSLLTIRHEKVFTKEIAVVKAFRAWTYLQLVINYGKVPLITDPILSESQAQKEQSKAKSDIAAICTYFIEDLKPYVDTEQPNYGSINGIDSRKYFIPVRLLLGDLCLWAQRYTDAAQYYHDYLASSTAPITTGNYNSTWLSNTPSFEFMLSSFSAGFKTSSNAITVVPMETSTAYGVYSHLNDVFSSTDDNKYYFESTPSPAYRALSQSQVYCKVYQNGNKVDTLYAPTLNSEHPLYVGDLRLTSTYSTKNLPGVTSEYSSSFQTIEKISSSFVLLYEPTMVYLRYAEALNRAGFPEAAFCVLKYGMTSENISKYVNATERANSGTLLNFSQYNFTSQNTKAIHSMGSGDSYANAYYNMPYPESALASYSDSVAYEQTKVEDLVCNEMALQNSYQGTRFYDLMRIALRRGDASYLAAKVAARNGSDATDKSLYNRLLDTANWYFPLP
jgi:hypothetical protein